MSKSGMEFVLLCISMIQHSVRQLTIEFSEIQLQDLRCIDERRKTLAFSQEYRTFSCDVT